MTQGRLPVGPSRKPPNESSSAPAAQDDRVARKVETIRHVLRLERDQNHANRAVIGGLDAFLERWIEDPDIKRTLEDAGIDLPSYDGLPPNERAAWVRETLERLRESEPAANSEQPETERVDEPLVSTTSPRSTAAADNVERPSPPARMDVPPDPGWNRVEEVSTTRARTDQRSPAERIAPPKPTRRRATKPAPKVTPVKSLDESLDAPSRMKAGLRKLGVETYRDALWAFPRRYVPVSPIARLTYGEQTALSVRVERAGGGGYTRGRQVMRVEAAVSDATGQVTAVWFGNPWVLRNLKKGSRLLLIGRLGEYRNRAQFQVETYEQLRAEDRMDAGELVPIYPLTKGVTQSGMRRLIGPAAEQALPLVQEFLPDDVIQAARLPGLREALGLIHHPSDLSDDERARRRLAFDELFLLQLGLLDRRRQQQRELGAPIPRNQQAVENVLSALPFTLTADQDHVVEEILTDIGGSAPMMRLLQGDVGSGKTVVAAVALVTAAASGFQGALMAPTEVLAEQHFRTLTGVFSHGNREANDGGPYRGFSGILPDRPLRIARLTGSMAAGAKSQLHELIARGDVDIVIGTHALIQEGVAFNNLGLAVVDEQHRFGVEQRAKLRNKGFAPHLLVMTATPIPRTMALAIYGDLDVSTIHEMPPGRPPIRTAIVPPHERERAYGFIRKEAEAHRQSFIICPLVEESEAVAAKAAVAEHERLARDVFPDLNVGLLHGRMRPAEKDRVMEELHAGDIDVLVSTAVVEVGIDVPNATVMMIDGADRFGLSQLHQYRGRVGRGTENSYCILVSESDTEEVNKRLAVMESTSDGFKVAEADLQLRGPGELLGTRQSGLPDLQVATFADLALIEEARRHALSVTADDPDLSQDQHAPLKEELQRFWERASDTPEGG
ncbi:MAG: ATP-dependent DNA helicase RecG [Chloroflexi bacterium]|nr:ATP-dependent DNA helicase RecG [Chloroflexota bacterium]